MAKKAKRKETKGKNKWKEILPKVEDFLEIYLSKKVPSLPMGLKKFMVAVWPYLILIGLLFDLPFLLSRGFILNFNFLKLIGLVTFVLQGIALPNIFKKRINGWRLAFYVVLIDSVVSFFSAGILDSILGMIILLYLIFQIKEFYHDE